MHRRFIVIVIALLALGVLRNDTKVVGQKPPDKEKAPTKPALPIPANVTPARADTGTFRVILTGYTVDRQTADNILEADGKGDEVFILAEVAQYDRYSQTIPGITSAAFRPGYTGELRAGGELTLRRSLVSVLMGDVNNQNNPPRIQAGSASDRGGLRTGDRFPTNEPWMLGSEPTSDRPPMLLWEGQLRQGRDLVIIVPTIWEWDGGNVALRQQFTADINAYFGDVTRRPTQSYGWRGLTGVDMFGAGDRPVGMLANDPWAPYGLSLNFDTAVYTANTSPNNMGLGVVVLDYIGRSEHYTLYLKIERR